VVLRVTPLADLLHADPAPGTVADHVACERSGAAAVVTLARPEAHNALGLAAWRRLATVFGDLARDEGLGAVVVRGAGGRAFGAGADIAEFPAVRMSAAAALDYNESIAAALRAVSAVPAPVIAMVRGLAVGGGCELAAACDVRIASADSRFGVPIGRLGVTLGYMEASALARLIGPAGLKYLVFSGRLVPADEALRLGLVQRVADDVVAETVALVDAVLAGSAVTMRATKAVADMCGRPITPSDAERLTRFAVEAYDGDDLKEGVAAFVSGRAPTFPGRSGGHGGT
jgi:enoyl-CoA hydratase